MEVWIHQFSFAGKTARAARQIEDWGFDGMLLADSQDLNADIWVELALAAEATETLKLGPGVTNLVTRHPTVTASAITTLQVESGARATLGLGRGDSAVSKIGLGPQPVAEFEAGLKQLQNLLSGETVTLENGTEAAIEWLAGEHSPKVPVMVAATGPKVITVAARQADAIDFTVGAELSRLHWAIAHAREAAGDRDVSLGAFLDIGVSDDPARARDLIRGSTAILARFGAESSSTEGLSEQTREGIEKLDSQYEEAGHGKSESAAALGLSDEFIDRFGVCGTPEQVTPKLKELAGLGLDRIVMVPGSLDADPEAVLESNRLFAEKVIPALKGRP
ncbi:MAG: LLM class flavin-dependent oxidoreductase [Solirubrobacterales bacterium]|nr:LLM class flavin-dependent oxidoreductase [Solirubrobacterales bacterium]